MRNPYDDDFADEHLGVACAECGEDAEGSALLQGHLGDLPLCGRCLDLVETCPQCEQQFWGPDGTRIYTGPEIHCRRCANAHPALVAGRMRELSNDERKGF